MVAVTIQNYAIDASNILGIIAAEGAQLAGIPTVTDTFVAASFTDGRYVELYGAFEPAVDAYFSGNIDILLARIDEIRLDAFYSEIGGLPYVTITELFLEGSEIASFVDSLDVDGGVSYVFSGNDTIVSGPGDDTLRGYAGDDIVLGGDGNDQVFGEDGHDELNGNRGFDFVDGGPGQDFVRGGQDADLVYGEAGDDWHINGNNGDDTVFGEDGNDAVFGGRDNDRLFAGDGDDDVSGDLGNDTLEGGFGVDWFFFRSGGGADLVLDFFPVEDGDLVQIEFNVNGSGITSPSAAYAAVFDTANGAVLNLGGGNSATLFGHTRASLAESDFAIF